ncbi:YIEGIA family protein [Paenibacillus sp. N1-5-1-14]|uniref:YIEGIA family protein n=1 Tax=Paenibacillus radicibacter TaxID=2972488 RepID=UPI00215941E0|nr:YIEGIA family protein [Paenibacillus radicibacter]MCR8642312.1 YIEGIA family protein [Paenibacillus radicibacter]
MNWSFLEEYTLGITLGVAFGIIARLTMLRTDYRQYPTYPHGKIIHIALGVIAAGLGAVAVPSLLNKDYTAITFLSLAAQQFRDVRNMERQSLLQMDKMELVTRGTTYIEGIAMVFEGRNYLVILTAFVTTFFAILYHWYIGIAAGLLSLLLANWLKKGKSLSEVAEISIGEVRVEGPDIYVGSIYMMNVGLKDSQEIIRKHGIGLLFKPKNINCRATLANLGQRQAILFDISTILGVYRDSGDPSLIPIAKLDKDDGTLGVLILPQDYDKDKALAAAVRVPMLESAVRMPTESSARRKS